jgi:uncharacterized protein (UPF0332 family)
VSPEVEAYLAKARECLNYARVNLENGLGNDAGRNAYLAEFHAAQALILDRAGRAAKTHHGVHTQFNRIAMKEPEIAPEFRQVFAQSYNLKAVADYETGADSVIPLARAAAAIESARRFVECIAALLSHRRPAT